MFRNITQYMEGLSELKIAVMLIAFFFFIGVIIFAFRLSKKQIQRYKNLPFEDGNENSNKIKNSEGEDNG